MINYEADDGPLAADDINLICEVAQSLLPRGKVLNTRTLSHHFCPSTMRSISAIHARAGAVQLDPGAAAALQAARQGDGRSGAK